MNDENNTLFIPVAEDFINALPVKEKVKVLAAITELSNGHFETLYIKTLRGNIKELIVRHHRIVFFKVHKTIYIVSTFIKKTNKTPKLEIDNAERMYKMIVKSK